MDLRWRYFLTAAAVVPLGLATRADLPWPALVADHGGDALYALMIYLGARGLLAARRPEAALALALGWCFGVELLQLYQAPWIQAVRATLPGRLVLGSGFLWIDLVRYLAGAGLGYAADRLWRHNAGSPG